MQQAPSVDHHEHQQAFNEEAPTVKELTQHAFHDETKNGCGEELDQNNSQSS